MNQAIPVKLNETSIHIIDILSACGWAKAEIARVFGIRDSHVGAIVRRESWRQVPRREVLNSMREVLGPDRTLNGLITITGKNCRLHPQFTDYAVSDDGCVFSRTKGTWNPGGRWVQLRPGPNRRGYLGVELYQDGRSIHPSVHTLVLETFVGPCPPGMECRHLDGCPANNRLDNLCWGSPAENGQDKRCHGTMRIGGRHPTAKLSEAHIEAMDCLAADGWTVTDIAMALSISLGNASSILHRRIWKHVPDRGRELLARINRLLQANEEPPRELWLLAETIRRNRLTEGEQS
jgi:hypothetical protein